MRSPGEPRDSAAVLLTRGGGECLEVYLVKRAPELRFFGGFHAFPGGVVEGADRRAGGPEDQVFARCARREIEEEIGVHLRELLPLTWRTTPGFAPLRYRTCFFHAELPADQEPRVRTGELVGGEFWRPAAACAAWERGELMVAPPVVRLLQLWRGRELGDFIAAARAEGEVIGRGELPYIPYTPGVLMAPLATSTLPPATTTNCLIVGTERLFLVDPAPVLEGERARLFRHFERVLAERGAEPGGVLVTHHHRDHIGAVAAAAERYGLVVHAHPATLERIHPAPARAQAMGDGERIELGRAPDGSPDWHLRAIHTPGHARGHLCFLDSRYRALIAGDMCATTSTILIEPPEGHLASYLKSLERLLAERPGFLYPAHGVATSDGVRLLKLTIRHRAWREEKLLAALGPQPRTTSELVPTVYDDVPADLHPYAERSLGAGLEKLVEEGRAAHRDGTWMIA